jgi:hypothetical protein
LGALADWRDFMTAQTGDLTTQLDYAQEIADQAQAVRTPCGHDAEGGAQ